MPREESRAHCVPTSPPLLWHLHDRKMNDVDTSLMTCGPALKSNTQSYPPLHECCINREEDEELSQHTCRSTPALNQSACETRTLASWCLPAMPLPRLHSCQEAKSTNCPLLDWELWVGWWRGGQSNQVTFWLGRPIGVYSESGRARRILMREET